jgi:hypothetical protein
MVSVVTGSGRVRGGQGCSVGLVFLRDHRYLCHKED